MFSYLHGVRPNNRRPAAVPPAAPAAARSPSNASGPFFHESPSSPGFRFDLSPQSESHRSSSSVNEASPVSLQPPILPPITNVASQRNSVVERATAEQDGRRRPQSAHGKGHSSQDTMDVPSALPPGSSDTRKPAVAEKEEALKTSRELEERPSLPTLEETRRVPTKQKRPIDIAFDNMRSYSEPPYRQSILTPAGEAPYRQSTLMRPANLNQYPQPHRNAPHPPAKFAQSPYYQPQSNADSQPQPLRQAPAPPAHRTSQRFQNRSSLQPQQQFQPPRQAPSSSSTSTQQDVPVAGVKQHRTSKLNLRNPLSLLARRRSSQVVAEAYSQNQHGPAVPLRDDFDPRIRGKVVHDFSAPRPGRANQVASGTRTLKAMPEVDEHLDNPKKPPRPKSTAAPDAESPASDHTPVFKEHFDDGPGAEQDGPAKRRSAAFMLQMSAQESQQNPDPSSLPAFARNLPTTFGSTIDNLGGTPSPPPKGPLEVVLESEGVQQSGLQPSPTLPPITRSRGSSITDQSFQGLGSPRRFKSNASRFSFDLAGVGSAAQEKILEDKHRQKAKRKERDSVLSLGDDMDEDDDNGYDDYDAMDDDGGFEEQIPGVNSNADALRESQLPVAQQALDNFHFASPNKSSFESITSPVSTGLTSPGTPRDINGQAIGFAVSKTPDMQLPTFGIQSPTEKNSSPRPKSMPAEQPKSNAQAESLQRVTSSDSNLASLPKRDSSLMGLPTRQTDYHDDDMYFADEGLMEDIGFVDDEEFDESVFDDNSNGLYGLPLRDRTLKPLDPPIDPEESEEEEVGQRLAPRSALVDHKADSTSSSRPSMRSEGVSAEMRDALTELTQPPRSTFSHTAGLTQDNLAAYDQNSLAAAAFRAAQNGVFDRPESVASKGGPSEPDGPAERIQQNRQMNQPIVEVTNFEEADDEDDDIVAAANAEALENDDDGFYGQEFGFFAKASGSSEAEYANGGYFGSRSIEDIHRSHSGRDAGFQEPSLTPITERSEWSNRNSTISLAHWGYPISSHPSEMQLSNMMNLPEEGMTLEALMKLRRTAFGAGGGSRDSLHSSNNSSGSPITSLAPGSTLPAALQQASGSSNVNMTGIPADSSTHNLASSLHSEPDNSSAGPASSHDSDPSPSGDSPVITFSPASVPLTMGPPPLPASVVKRTTPPPQPIGPPPPVPQQQDMSPKRRSATASANRTSWQPGHRRNSSGAESVSYKEEGGRWVCERKRVGDGGEVEVVGRSVVEGGRI